ncbi:MAG: hypothetical protein H0Z19_07015 [Archaeoglobus sp.]|uniref:hypothetical protein n=1 Tax=Archaeoglobus sp. TaxID=1872626 RepID=UPI001D66ACF1|nr:hypothetical protein [Archaeoglobus sp.]MBO8180215.1 hypothetical protein [Archaeoglobus sp.]
MKDEQRKNLLDSLENLSISGSVIMTFAVLVIVLKVSGLDVVHSVAIAFAFSTAVLIFRLKK